MRNAVKRVTHKERAQPASRKKFGLLEKHKDYVERAKDYKKKQSHLTKLRRKALDRNPDEFYFKMNTSQVRNGIHHINNDKNARVDNSVISMLKTQDLGYITTKKSADDSKIRKLKENLHLIGEQKVKHHKVFVSSEEELEDFDAATHFNTVPELVGRSFNRPKLVTPSAENGLVTEGSASNEAMIDPRCLATSLADQVRRAKGKAHKASKGDPAVPAAYRELRERVKRSKNLKSTIEKLALQRNLTNSKGTKRKIVLEDGSAGSTDKSGKASKGEKVVYKWKKQRAH